MVANVETYQFLLSCRSGIDLTTLQLIQGSGGKCELWKSPGLGRLTPWSSPDYFQTAMRDLFLSLLDLLTKQPHDLRALQIKCDGLVNRSSDIYRSTIRPEDGDLFIAKATFIRV